MVSERDQLDRDIDMVRHMLNPTGAVEPEAANVVRLHGVSVSTTAPSITAIVMDMVADGSVVTLTDVVARAKAIGNTSDYNSISSVISRLRRDGKLAAGPARGTSMLPPKNATEGDGGAGGPNLGSNSEVTP